MKVIKRLSIYLLLLTSSLLLFGLKTHAEVGVIDWAIDNPYSTYYAATISLDIPSDAYKITFYVPDSDRHLLGDGGIDSYVAFKKSGTTIVSYDIPEIHGSEIFGTYTFNLEAMGLYQQIDEIVFYIMQDWASPPDIPTYTAALEAGSDLFINYNLPFDITVEWYGQYLFSTYYGVISNVDLLTGTRTISLFIPTTQFHELLYNGVYAEIEFYGASDELIHQYNLQDTGYVGGLHFINLELLESEGFSELPLYTYDQIKSIKILIPQNYDTQVPNGYFDFLTENSSITFNDNIKQVIFYSEGAVYEQELFDTVPTVPTDPIKSSSDTSYYYEFDGWYKANGFEYLFTPVRDEETINNTFYLYAKFNKIINDSYTPTDPTPDDAGRIGAIFARLDWNVNTGYLITLIVALGASIFVYVKYNVSAIVVIVIDAAILGFYTYLGFLPVFVSIALWAFLFMAFVMTRRE